MSKSLKKMNNHLISTFNSFGENLSSKCSMDVSKTAKLDQKFMLKDVSKVFTLEIY